MEQQLALQDIADISKLSVEMADIDVTRHGITKISTGTKLSEIQIDPGFVQIGKKIGEGYTSRVYRGRICKKSIVAIKIINIFEKQSRDNLLNDLKTLSMAKHSSLVQFYGAYFDEGSINLILQYMDLGSLRNLIKSQRKIKRVFPEPTIIAIAKKLLQGLLYLHTKNHQIHRDFKPQNILLNSAGEVKLTDFGLSKELGKTQAMTKTYVGTTAYMSPQRILNQDYSYPSDVWAFGLVLQELALGQSPIKHTKSTISMINSILAYESRLTPDSGYSDELRLVIATCLQKQPGKRPLVAQLLSNPLFGESVYNKILLQSFFASVLSEAKGNSL